MHICTLGVSPTFLKLKVGARTAGVVEISRGCPCSRATTFVPWTTYPIRVTIVFIVASGKKVGT